LASSVFETALPPPFPNHNSAIITSIATESFTMPTNQSFSLLRACIWRTQEIISYSSFLRYFSLVQSNVVNFPLLAAVIKHEENLPVIKYIGDILAWHALLFRVLQAGTISRDEVNQ